MIECLIGFPAKILWLGLMLIAMKTAVADVVFQHVRSGGGDLTNLNYVINLLTLDLDLSIEPKPIDYKVGFITVPLLATIGETGVCKDLKINEGGDIFVTGKFLEDRVFLPDYPFPFQVYEMEILADVIQFECTIPLMVEVEGFFSFVNTIDGFGDLTFRSEAASLSQKIVAYSPDFVNVPPLVALPGLCEADPDVLTYVGDSLGDVAGVDITDIIIGELESDPSYVFNDVAIELCKLGEQLADVVTGLLIADAITNSSSNFLVPNPFIPDDNNVTSALKLEEKLYATKPEAVPGLLDLQDQSNFFVDLVIANSSDEPAILNTILTFLADCDGVCTADPLLLFAAEFLGFELEEDGSVQDFDLTQFFNGSLDFNFETSLDDVLLFDLSIVVDYLTLDYYPPEPEVEGEPAPYILPPLLAFSKHTAIVENINFNNFQANGGIRLNMSLINLGVEGNDFLEQPFELLFKENIELTFRWEGFLATFGVLFAVNVDYLKETEIGPLMAAFADCLLAVFPLAPAFTGFVMDHDLINLALSQLNDAILVLVTDIVEVAFPVYQSVLPRLIEKLVTELIVFRPLFNETTCGKADPGTDDLAQFPYDFTNAAFSKLTEFATPETLNKIFAGINLPEIGIYLVGDQAGFEADEGVGFELRMPQIQGWTQNISIYIQGFSIEGLVPPFFRDLKLFEVLETSVYSPQYLRTIANVGKPGDEVGLRFSLNITIKEPTIDEEFDPADASPDPPDVFYAQNNLLDITFWVDTADILLDFYLKYTQYDMDSFQLQEMINLGCWGKKLDFPGGISLMTVSVDGIHTEVNCTICDNDMVQLMAESFRDESTWPEQLVFVDSFMDRFGFLLMNLFQIDRYEQTKEVCTLMCDDLSYDFIGNLSTYEFDTYQRAFGGLLPLVSFFVFAIIMPCLVARWLRHYGPKLKHVDKKPLNKQINNVLLSSARSGGDKALVEKAMTLELPMYKNPLVSKRAKIVFPIVMVLNFILFIVSNVGDAVRLNLDGQFFLVPYESKNFRSLSIIGLVVQMFKQGGWLIGFLLLSLSVLWPYVKMIVLGCCWYLPPTKLGVERRGRIIEFVDFFGKFSFVEYHFLVFLFVVFQLKVASPQNTFLPEQDFFNLELEIEPQISLFTYSFAIVLSIIMSNTMMVYQHNIEDETRIKDREELLKTSDDIDKRAILALDEEKIKVTNWTFRVDEEDADSKTHYMYHFNITKKATLLMAATVAFASIILFAASLTSSLNLEIYGIFAYMIRFAGESTEYELSVFQLLYRSISLYSDNLAIYFVGLVFIMTILIIPMVQTVLLFVLLFKPVTLKMARTLTEAHRVVSVWCCMDVFVIAVSLAALELPTVSARLSRRLDFCDEMGEVMQNFFKPMRYVDQDDVDAGCVGIRSSISSGAYLAVLTIFVLNMMNFFVSRMLYSFIADREKVEVRQVNQVQVDPVLKPYHRKLQRMGLIVINKDIVDSDGTPLDRKELTASHQMKHSQANPMFETEERKQSFFSAISESSDKSTKKRRRKRTRPMSSLVEVKNANPLFVDKTEHQSLTERLNNFYDEVGASSKKSRSKVQASKALGSADGMNKLNSYLSQKYGRCLSEEVDF